VQTKFKWTDKQRLLVISAISLGIVMSPSVELSRHLAEDIYIISKGTVENLNTDKELQEKLKKSFELQIFLGLDGNNLYNQLLELEKEKDSEQISLSA
jgi:hypothetical protein